MQPPLSTTTTTVSFMFNLHFEKKKLQTHTFKSARWNTKQRNSARTHAHNYHLNSNQWIFSSSSSLSSWWWSSSSVAFNNHFGENCMNNNFVGRKFAFLCPPSFRLLFRSVWRGWGACLFVCLFDRSLTRLTVCVCLRDIIRRETPKLPFQRMRPCKYLVVGVLVSHFYHPQYVRSRVYRYGNSVCMMVDWLSNCSATVRCYCGC